MRPWPEEDIPMDVQIVMDTSGDTATSLTPKRRARWLRLRAGSSN
jgi:hypothetical protein